MRATEALRPALPLIGSLTAALLLAACGSQSISAPPATVAPPDDTVATSAPADGGPDPSAEPTIALPPDGPLPVNRPFDERARQVAAEWEARGLATAWQQRLIALEPLTTDPGGFPDSASKSAYADGWVRVTSTLPSPTKPTTTVTTGSQSATLDLVSAESALDQVFPGRTDDCPRTDTTVIDCALLEVTGARLTTTSVLTNRGEVDLPAWAFTFAGVDDPLVQVAVDPADLSAGDQEPIPGADGGKYPGVVASQNLTSVSGSTVTYTVGVGACDADITPRLLETADLVLVGATVTRIDGACIDLLKIQPVQVTTREPVGGRPVVDALTGVVLAPATR